MGREILFVRVAFAGKDARELVMQNEIVWTVREREEEVEKEKKRQKIEKTENVGHQLENVGRTRSRKEKDVGMKQNERASSVVRRSAGNF